MRLPGASALLLVSLVLAPIVAPPSAPGGSVRASASLAPVQVLVSKLQPNDVRPERAVARLGGQVERPLSVIEGFVATVPASAVRRLSAVPGIRWASPNRSMHLLAQYGQDTGVASAVYTDVSRASKAWGMGVTGAGVNVAVIDTGVNTNGDLAGQVVHSEDFTSEAADPSTNGQDTFGHGTFVAGLIAGSGAGSAGAVKGIAPAAKIVSLKIAGRDGSTDVVQVLEALEWVATFKDAYGIRVLNLSLGFATQQSATVDPLDFAVERVWNSGVVVVAASGNAGQPGSVMAPGNDPFVITAGSETDLTTVPINDDRVSTFSSYGPTVDGYAKPDIVASGRSVVSSRSPGSTIDTTYPDSAIGATYARGSGTSFSSAIVSGVAALVISRTWTLNPNQVKNRITSTARVIGGGVTPASGAGAIDAFGASMSQDLTAANQGLTPAVGGGSLQATRGGFCVRGTDGSCLSDADADALLGFDETRFFGSQWAGSQWAGSQWAGSQWAGTQWTGSQWAGSQWAGSQWAGSQWAGSQWAGSQWAGSQWAGSQWAGSQWAGSQWAGSQWAGSQWTFLAGS